MKAISVPFLAFALLLTFFPSCKKKPVTIIDFSSYVATDEDCRITGTTDTTQWTNSVLTRQQDTSLLTFGDNVVITDSMTGPVTISPPCPDSSNGFFIWNVSPAQQCKLRLVFVNTNLDILYYNAYGLSAGPITIGFDFRSTSTFHSKTNYRMYYGFYNANDSLYVSGHGDIRIE